MAMGLGIPGGDYSHEMVGHAKECKSHGGFKKFFASPTHLPLYLLG